MEQIPISDGDKCAADMYQSANITTTFQIASDKDVFDSISSVKVRLHCLSAFVHRQLVAS